MYKVKVSSISVLLIAVTEGSKLASSEIIKTKFFEVEGVGRQLRSNDKGYR